MTAALVIFAVGNPSRGDDAIGPELSARLARWLEAEGLTGEVELIDDFQLNIEHVLDLQGRELALFIDAGVGNAAPFSFGQVFPSAALPHSSHALPPESVLHVWQQTEAGAPPAAFVLCVKGEDFALGAPLSAAAIRHVDEALLFLQELCRHRTPAEWAIMRVPGLR